MPPLRNSRMEKNSRETWSSGLRTVVVIIGNLSMGSGRELKLPGELDIMRRISKISRRRNSTTRSSKSFSLAPGRFGRLEAHVQACLRVC